MYIGGAAMATMCAGSGCVDSNAWIRETEATGTDTEVSNISSPTVVETNISGPIGLAPFKCPTVVEMNRSPIKKENPFGKAESMDSTNPLNTNDGSGSGSGLECNNVHAVLKRQPNVQMKRVDTSPDQLSSPKKNMTLSEKVALIVEQLGVDPSLTTLPQKVAAANEIMGIQGIGTMLQQVETLRSQLGV